MIRPLDPKTSDHPIVHALHAAWGAAVGRPRYHKASWKPWESAAWAIERRAATRARPIERFRVSDHPRDMRLMVAAPDDRFVNVPIPTYEAYLADKDVCVFLEAIELLCRTQGDFSSDEIAMMRKKGLFADEKFDPFMDGEDA